MPTVLFVCTANICRSPMAMALFQLQMQGLPDTAQWRVASAGTWAPPGRAAHPHSQQVVRERGLDLSGHRSQSVNGPLLEAADLVLTMERGHKEALRVEFPAVARRLYLLSEMAGLHFDIPDPVGGAVDEFRVVAGEIERLLRQGQERIVSLANGEARTE